MSHKSYLTPPCNCLHSLTTDTFCGIIFLQRYLIYAVLWSFSGDGRLKMRAELGEYIRRITTVPLPSAPNVPIIDYEVKPLSV